MIKVTVQEAVQSVDTINKLLEQKLTALVSYKIARLAKKLDVELELFNIARNALINKYGMHDAAGNLIKNETGNLQIAPEHIQEFSQELNEVLATTIELDAEKISIGDLSTIQITPREISNLLPFLE